MDISSLPPYAFVVFLPTVWVLVLLLMARRSGWRRLADRYPGAAVRDGDAVWTSVFLRRARYQGVVIRAGATHMHVSVLPIFRLGHRPFSVPWEEIAAEPSTKWGFPAVKLTTAGASDVTILVSGDVGAPLIEASRGRMRTPPTDDSANSTEPARGIRARLALAGESVVQQLFGGPRAGSGSDRR